MSIKNLCAVAVALALSPQLQAKLLISEYVEGSSNNKAIELANLGSVAVVIAEGADQDATGGGMDGVHIITRLDTACITHPDADDARRVDAPLLIDDRGRRLAGRHRAADG